MNKRLQNEPEAGRHYPLSMADGLGPVTCYDTRFAGVTSGVANADPYFHKKTLGV